MINCQNVYIVSQVQGNGQNTGVIDVEAFTSVATHVLRDIAPNQFEVNISLQDHFIHCKEHIEIYHIL